MATHIEDGTGTGRKAKVTTTNRLAVASAVLDEHAVAALQGDSFNLNVDELTLTDAAENALWYLKNDSGKTMVIADMYLNHAASTGGSGPAYVRVYRNPTGGTVVTDASTSGVSIGNRNFGSTKTSGCTAYRASAVGKTLTGGSVLFLAHRNAGAQSVFAWSGTVVLPPGASVGVSFQAPSGNTSMKVIVNATFFFPPDADV